MPGFDDDLRLAHVLADAVERTALDQFGSLELETRVGPDGVLTTQTATRLEELLRHQLQRTRPRDRVEGRLLEPTGHGDRRWVLEAIDGTANYVRGVPVWATLIALVVEERPVVGLVAAPSLSRRWWAGEGSGTWTGRTLSQARRVGVSETAVLEHASVSADDVAAWQSGPHRAGFAELARRSWRTRAFGDFWSLALLSEGAVDVSLTAWADPVQLPALVPLVQEAGGRLSDTLGGAPALAAGGPGQPVVASNGVLHDQLLEVLGGSGQEPVRAG